MVKKRKRAAGSSSRPAAAVAADAAAADGGDVHSDEDSDDQMGKAAADDEEDDFFETPDEKRVRLAKEYLRSLETNGNSNIQEKLTKDVADHERRTKSRIQDLQLGEQRFLKGHKEAVTCVCLSQDERTIWTGGKDCALLRWDVETGKKDVFPGGRHQFECGGHFEKVQGVCLLEQQNLLASVGVDRLVRLWDHRAPARSACVDKLHGHMGVTTCCAADPDGSKLYTASHDKSLKIWDLSGRRCSETLLGHVQGVCDMDIYMKGRPVTGGLDKTVRLWKVDKDTHLMFNKHIYSVDAVSALDADRFLSGSQDGNVHLWTAMSKKPVATAFLGAGGAWVTALGAMKGGDVFYSGTSSGRLQTWRVEHIKAGEDGAGKKGSTALTAVGAPVDVAGCINAVVAGQRIMVCAIGREHKSGSWFFNGKAKNGIMIVPMSYSKSS